MTWDRFVREFWEHTKLLAVHPAFSMGELVLILAYLAFKPRWWLAVPLIFVWLVWRNNRDSDGTATAAHCEDNAVPQDCQARAESIAQHGSGG